MKHFVMFIKIKHASYQIHFWQLPLFVIEQFSNDCRKTKTKAVTPTNHNRGKQCDEPITIPCKLSVTCSNRGKNHAYMARLVLVLLLIG